MNPIIIKIKNLSKTYNIYKNPLERLKGLLLQAPPSEVFRALRDISFSVNKGETLGIIGENGAGKSTLLKVLSGVIIPDEGEVEVKGAMLSILELGVGFHPEFTGRENIFFYGDMLGFQRAFIKERLASIIDFSELGGFINTPVKTYSSGMLVRLAFATVTAFDPEVLILDEVLAVGDIHFQRKSLNRVLDIKKRGGTILFCSHDTYHVRMICDRAIWLKDGAVEMEGDAEKVVLAYESYQFQKDDSFGALQAPPAGVQVMIEDMEIKADPPLKTGSTIVLKLSTRSQNRDIKYHVTVSLKLPDGRGIYVTGTHMKGLDPLMGDRVVEIEFADLRLLSGNYYFHLRTFDETGLLCYHERATDFFSVDKGSNDMGICYLENQWKIK